MPIDPFDGRRTVFVHDYLNQYGGAERLLEALHELAPDAPTFTSMYDRDGMPALYRDWDIRTTWIERIPDVYRSHQRALPAYPLAFAGMKLPECDLVISSSSAFAKAVKTPQHAVHVAYIHSPMRFAWQLDDYVEREAMSPMMRRGLQPLMWGLRKWDRRTNAGIDQLVANSTTVQRRIRQYWGRDSVVIYPPVEVDQFAPAPADRIDEYALIMTRLVPYKRIDLVIQAFNQLGRPLWIAGDGRDRARLEAMAGPNVRFLGYVKDNERRELYARCRMAIFPAEDDFGIAQVEAQAAGRPVIAFNAGGAAETVIDGRTGVLFNEQTVDSIIAAVARFDGMTFNPQVLVDHAAGFSRERFLREMRDVVSQTVARKQGGARAGWS